MSDKSRDSGEDFSLHSSNEYPNAIWSDGTTMWVTDSGDDKVFAYKMSDKSRDSGKDFDTLDAAGNRDPRGLWSDGTTMWVTDNEDKEIYAYKMSDKSRDSGKDFDTLDAAGNDSPRGIWSDGTTMWVVDSDDDKVYAYKMSDKSRDSGKEFDLHSENTGPYGIWSYDRATMWVADRDEDKLYAYNLPAAAPTIVLVAVTSMPALDTDTYGAGETIEVSVTFSEAVNIGGSPVFRFSLGNLGVGRQVDAAYESGAGSAALVFGYTVVSSDEDDDGIWIGHQGQTLVGTHQTGTITSVATSIAADLTHAALGVQTGHKVDGSRTAGNNAPVFADASATREVVENSAVGTSVGAVVTATDADNDTLTYSLEGTDAASFEIDSGTGQIKTVTGVTYDHEATQNTYSVTVKAADGNGGSDTIAVTIAVTDVNEKIRQAGQADAGGGFGLDDEPDRDLDEAGAQRRSRDQHLSSGVPRGHGRQLDPGVQRPSLTTTVTGLTASTSYQVQVRTFNGEALSDWSDPSDAVSTNAEMTTPACTLNTGDIWCGVVTVERFTLGLIALDGFGSG